MTCSILSDCESKHPEIKQITSNHVQLKPGLCQQPMSNQCHQCEEFTYAPKQAWPAAKHQHLRQAMALTGKTRKPSAMCPRSMQTSSGQNMEPSETKRFILQLPRCHAESRQQPRRASTRVHGAGARGSMEQHRTTDAPRRQGIPWQQ